MKNDQSVSLQSNQSNFPPNQNSCKQYSEEHRLKAEEVAELYSIGVSTVWKWVKEHRLPSPERYGCRCSRWRYGDLIQWMDSKVHRADCREVGHEQVCF